MPFVVDASRAPLSLRITFGDEWPSLEEQQVWRHDAVKKGILSPTTRALIDVRPLKQLPNFSDLSAMVSSAMKDGGWPLSRAYLTTPGLHFGVARQLQMMVPQGISVEVFTDERAAENWLTALRHG